jgi:aspartyl-tRNA(Asn)/glutamyl-tRNA(Gln) amidotransferase subunit A
MVAARKRHVTHLLEVRVTSLEQTETALAAIHQDNSRLNAFITVMEQSALADARRADRELAKGKRRSAIHGVPISLKDLFYTRGVRTTAGSKILADFVPRRDAEVVRRLRAAGAVIIGKNNLHEWAYGVSSTNPHYGAVRNPYDIARIPGGSSGGSAAAVAAGMGAASLGTDTGGSIRIPASLCGVVGLKPTYGACSLDGVIPLSSTMDHVGPIADSLRTAAAVFEVISGRKLKPLDQGVKGLRIGVPEKFFFERLQPEVERNVRQAIARLEKAGARIRTIPAKQSSEAASEANEAGRTILLVEALETHRRYNKRRGDYGDAVRLLLERGEQITPAELRSAKRVRREFTREFTLIWERVDLLVTPTIPVTAPLIGQEKIGDENTRACLTRFVRVFNITGVPALSVPCGRDDRGLPIGLQIIGPKRAESTVLQAGLALE